MTALFSLVLFAASAAVADIDLGAADQKDPPPAKERVAPKDEGGIKKIELRATVAGTVPKAEKATVYVLVTPLSNPGARDAWWVQEAVERDGDKFTSAAQFGEAAAGLNEYFGVLVIVSDQKYDVGQQLNGLPKATAYSKLTIVKRTK